MDSEIFFIREKLQEFTALLYAVPGKPNSYWHENSINCDTHIVAEKPLQRGIIPLDKKCHEGTHRSNMNQYDTLVLEALEEGAPKGTNVTRSKKVFS